MKATNYQKSDIVRRYHVARARPAGFPFRLRLLAYAIMTVCAATARAGTPVNAGITPGMIPTGGVVTTGSATIRAPQATATGQLLQINQASQQAIINWSSFNIGSGSAVEFNQPNSSAEVLNRINDSNPTVIQGQLTANGHVYLINQNGILFDKGSQVNVNSLIASSLDISDATFTSGITSGLSNNLGKLVAQGSLKMILDQNGNPLTDLQGQPLTNMVANYGTIKSVDAATGQDAGGTIMLFAPQVENYGQITANNGQVVLAAGGQVYLQLYYNPASSVGNPANDPNGYLMRGLVVKIQAGSTPVNLSQLIAANYGSIETDRGNTTLTGMIVNQAGRVSANTASTLNGSIWLMADPTNGALTLTPGSVTQTQPVSDGTTLAQDQNYSQYNAVIQLQGSTVDNFGSVVAPGGTVAINASTRFLLEPGSLLSVAGTWSDLPYDANFLTVKLTSFDLANDPMQKGGFLLGQTVTVDTRQPSPPLFSISDDIASIEQSVTEKAAVAGSIVVGTAEFISAPGSTVDVSGGGYIYSGGINPTSSLVSNGKIYSIETAPIDL
ncbi:MAG: filamentous hemagglutinin N-terminal domain-containing protein, partial [Thiobacillaceae bacterium]